MLPETKGLIGKREFGLLNPKAYIINFARGSIWDEKALYHVLHEKKIAGAGSEVFEMEPAIKDPPLFQLENFIGTPPSADHTEEALRRVSRVAVDIVRVLEGKNRSIQSTILLGIKPVYLELLHNKLGIVNSAEPNSATESTDRKIKSLIGALVNR